MINKKSGTFILIAGASGSGKSTFMKALAERLEAMNFSVSTLAADAFFKAELPQMRSPADGELYPDWNSPESVEMEALADAVERERASGADFVLAEGVTVLCDERLRGLADAKIFIDASIETRIYRRIARNHAAGQTVEFIGGYYLKCARYREREFALPSAKFADLHVDNEFGFDIEAETERILKLLQK